MEEFLILASAVRIWEGRFDISGSSYGPGMSWMDGPRMEDMEGSKECDIWSVSILSTDSWAWSMRMSVEEDEEVREALDRCTIGLGL